MLFRRRKPATVSGRLREFYGRERAFRARLRYLSMRVLRLSSSPHSIAVGVAAGCCILRDPVHRPAHSVIAFALAYLLSGNLIAAGISDRACQSADHPVHLSRNYESRSLMHPRTGGSETL